MNPLEPDPWHNDLIQFARLIEESQAAGAFTPEVITTMGASMDLDDGQVHSLLERARVTWERLKHFSLEGQEDEEDEVGEPDVRLVRCAVVCHCADGGPDVVPCVVFCTTAEYVHGVHYESAKEYAEELRYDVGTHDLVIDENDPGFRLLDIDWGAIQPSEWVLSEGLASEQPQLIHDS